MMPAVSRKFSFVLAFGLLSFLAVAQPELGHCEQEVDEKAATQVPRALKAWQGNNSREVERYLSMALRLQGDYADALYLLGEFNFRKGDLRKARFVWEKLLKVCPDYKPELDFFLGIMSVESGERQEGIERLERYLTNQEREFGFDKEAKAAIEEARFQMKMRENAVPYDPQPVLKLSTANGEYLATISPDQETMYFTRRSRKVNRNDGPAARARLVEEFFFAERQDDGLFSVGEAMPSPFNRNYNEGGPSITANNTELYFTVCEDVEGYKNCDIYFSERDPYGYWTTPQSVGDHINRRDSWESQPSVSANGDQLFFVSNRKGGVGGLDIYQCTRAPGEDWSAPRLLSASVNTPKDEKSPFIHSDSETLYFTSDGHPGMGGFDIFLAKAINDTAWQDPQNIGYPINTEKDDLGLFVSLDGKTAYFATNDLRGPGDWDIFSFEMPENARPAEVALVVGTLADAQNNEAQDFEGAAVEIKNLSTRETTRLRVDSETGSYAGVVRQPKSLEQDLMVTVQKKGTAFSSRYIKGSELKSNGVVKAPLELQELEIGKEYTLNDINFATNSYALDAVAKAVIEEFVRYMNNNPGLSAEVQGHTDNVGEASSNLSLSRNRAKAVYDYAVASGVSSGRLSWKGYGQDKPIEDNDTETGRARNRRTVFVITSR